MAPTRNLLNLLLITTALLTACGQPPAMKITSTATPADWQQLTRLRVAFGHQSVGFNLISGIKTLAKEHNVTLDIQETRTPLTQPGIHHFRIGENGAPTTKFNDFDAAMTGPIADSADIALMKLCYIDFTGAADPQKIAQGYIAELDKLTSQYPNTRFVPVTAPLTTVQTGPKAWVKELLGRDPDGYVENAKRQTFNRVLRDRYRDSGVLFDIAAIESDAGQINIFYQGQPVEALHPALTDDGGHLNAAGQRLLGDALVHHLATVKRP